VSGNLEDSINYVGATAVGTGTAGQFADEPHLVVDVPPGKECSIAPFCHC
jgi:hypothetical protein